jgi:hypothetical protein
MKWYFWYLYRKVKGWVLRKVFGNKMVILMNGAVFLELELPLHTEWKHYHVTFWAKFPYVDSVAVTREPND